MNKLFAKISLALLCCLVIGGNGCILETIVAQLVLTSETCATYEQQEDSANWNTPYVLDNYAADLDSALAEAGWEREDIESVTLMAAHYGVTKIHPDNTQDWEIEGSVTVQRTDVPGPVATLLDYSSVTVNGALDQKIVATLNSAGVDVINQALAAYLPKFDDDGELIPGTRVNPELVFNDVNGAVTPDPADDVTQQVPFPLHFDWKVWITAQVILNEETDVPDPWN